jgi:hypothetical protein
VYRSKSRGADGMRRFISGPAVVDKMPRFLYPCGFRDIGDEPMSYAIIRTGGKQYRVTPGDLIRIEKLPQEAGADVEFNEVLMASDGGRSGARIIGVATGTGRRSRNCASPGSRPGQ